MTYQFIRVDRTLVVPATSVFNDDGEFVHILCPGFDKPFSCGGEIGEGLRMFLQGARTFRVTPNGVLDIYSSLVENIQAQKAFTGVSDVIVDAEIFGMRPGGIATFNMVTDPPKPTGPPGVLNIDAIARGIKKRQSYE